MQIDLTDKAQSLLEALANSVHDRNPTSLNPFFFNSAEIHVATKWLEQFIGELKQDCVCV